MLKRFVIVSLVLLLVGASELAWVLAEKRKEREQTSSYRSEHASEADKYIKQYDEWLRTPPEQRGQLPLLLGEYGGAKTKAQLRREQQERLKADLDRLASGEFDANPLANVLYGEDWRDQVRKYKKGKERGEFVFTGSVVCTSVGGTVLAWCVLVWITRRLLRGVSYLGRFFPGAVEGKGAAMDEKSVRKQRKNTNPGHAASENATQPPEPSEGLADLGVSGAQTDSVEGRRLNRAKIPLSAGSRTVTGSASNPGADKFSRSNSDADAEKIAVLLSDNKSVATETMPKAGVVNSAADVRQKGQMRPKVQKNLSKVPDAEIREAEDSIKAQSENIERQMAEFKQMAQSVRQTTLEHSKPLNSALKELTQQVSAIREYAAYQQERVEKLQDGYDWNIIRTFCLRVIRCIDNLESRIEQLDSQDVKSTHLEEVKDELIFALESSGIEQFEPGINSEYRGQEKYAEAVKVKERCADPKQAGRIAKVIRPGYQYFINEDNVKVVRTAQVKLFG
jgi:molecular chaperone GrpE (heat shock protein)